MNQTTFIYNQEQAIKAGAEQFLSETGAYICNILSAEYFQSQSGALSLVFSIETEEGLKGNYISVYYQGKEGQELQSGHNMIQAIMGCTNVKSLTQSFTNGKAYAPELANKKVGLFLQKVLRTKNDGSDTYSFQIICPFNPNSRKTLLEQIENKPAERIDWLVANYKDKDERTKNQVQANTPPYQHQPNPYAQAKNGNYTPPPQNGDFDDVIPF